MHGIDVRQQFKTGWGNPAKIQAVLVVAYKGRTSEKRAVAFVLPESRQKALHCAQAIYMVIFLASGSVHAVPLRSSFCIYKGL